MTQTYLLFLLRTTPISHQAWYALIHVPGYLRHPHNSLIFQRAAKIIRLGVGNPSLRSWLNEVNQPSSSPLCRSAAQSPFQLLTDFGQQQGLIPASPNLCPITVVDAVTGLGWLKAISRPWLQGTDILGFVNAKERIDKWSLVRSF